MVGFDEVDDKELSGVALSKSEAAEAVRVEVQRKRDMDTGSDEVRRHEQDENRRVEYARDKAMNEGAEEQYRHTVKKARRGYDQQVGDEFFDSFGGTADDTKKIREARDESVRGGLRANVELDADMTRSRHRYEEENRARDEFAESPIPRAAKKVKPYIPADTSFLGGLKGLGGIVGGKAYAKGKEIGTYAVKQGAKEIFGMSVEDKDGKKKLKVRAIGDLFAGVSARKAQREKSVGFLYGGGLQPQRGRNGDPRYGIGFPNAPKRTKSSTSKSGTSRQSSSVFGELNFFGNPFATRKAPVTRKKKGRKSTGAKRASERSTSEFDWFW